MLKQINGNEKYYTMSLADGKTWGFCGTETIIPWLEELKNIMKLKESKGNGLDHKLLFLSMKRDNLPPGSDESLWTTYKQGRVLKLWYSDSLPETFVELNRDFIDHPEIKIVNMILSLRVVFRHYSKREGGPFHAALAELDGKGVVITGPSGRGKSTCSRRFPSYWKPLCDDTCLIIKDKAQNFRAHPMPTWSDHLWAEIYSTSDASHSVPLKAVFFLEQSEKDGILPVNKTLAIQKLFAGMKQVWDRCWDREGKEERKAMTTRLFHTSCEIADKVPFYTLNASLNGRFWEEIEKVL